MSDGFHWRDGWHFWKRPQDGTVVIYHEDAPVISAVGPIAPAEWASIAAYVADGGSSESYARASANGSPPVAVKDERERIADAIEDEVGEYYHGPEPLRQMALRVADRILTLRGERKQP